jgi:hypothetical protein
MSVIRLPQAPQQYDPQWANQLILQLEQVIELLSQPANTGWTTTNITATRALDANHTTGAVDGEAVTNVLCTLIEDMKARQLGMLGK